MPSTKPTIGLLFNVEALNRQNEAIRKQSQKRRKQVKEDELIQEKTNKTEASIKRSRSTGKDIISKRKAAQLAISKRAAQNAAKKEAKAEESMKEEVEAPAKKLNSDKTEKTTKTDPKAKPTQTTETPKTDLEKQLEKIIGKENFFSEEEILSMAGITKDIAQLKERAVIENWPKPEIDLESGSIIDQILDPKNLVDSMATEEELAQAKAQATLVSRFMRRTFMTAMPTVLEGAAKALAEEGIDLTDPAQNPNIKDELGQFVHPDPAPLFAGKKLNSKYFKDPKETNPNSNAAVDKSIFASVFKAIEMNQILQELGIKTEVVSSKVQKTMGEQLIAEAKETFEKNADAIQKSHEQDCASKALRILGDIIGAIFIVVGMPYLGVPIILASEGLIEKMVVEMAKAFGVPEYVIQSIIVAFAIIAATVVSIGTLGTATSLAFGAVLFVAGLVGWIHSTIGIIDSLVEGREDVFDSSKYPSWVTWAALGVELGLGLALNFASVVKSVAAMGKSLMALPKSLASVGRSFAQNAPKWAAYLGAKIKSMPAALSAGSGGISKAARSASAAAKSIASAAKSVSSVGSSVSSRVSQVVQRISDKISQFVKYVQDMAAKFSKQMNQAIARMKGAQGAGQSGSPANTLANANAPATQTNVAARVQSDAALKVVSKQVDNVKAVTATPGTANSSTISSIKSAIVTKCKGVVDKFTAMMKSLDQMIKNLTRKLLMKLLTLKQSLIGAEKSASQLAGMMKGTQEVAEKADKILESLKSLMELSQKVAKWMLLAASGSQAVVQFEIARTQLEMGEILREAAELSGEVTILENFIRSFNLSLKSIQESKKQHAKDSAGQIETLGSILIAERRNNNLLMSA